MRDIWYEARDNFNTIDGRLWSLGEALERAYRHLKRPILRKEPVQIWYCEGNGGSSENTLIMTVTTSDDGIVAIKDERS